MRLAIALCAVFVLSIAGPLPAFADASTTIDIGGALSLINQAVATVLLTAAPVFLKMAFDLWRQKTGVDVDQAHRQVVLTGIDNAIAFAQHALDGSLAGKTSLDVRNAMVAHAFTYLAPKIPDAMARLGITSDGLQQLIAANVAKLVGVDQPAGQPALLSVTALSPPATGAVPLAPSTATAT
jgi:hypothetical protein